MAHVHSKVTPCNTTPHHFTGFIAPSSSTATVLLTNARLMRAHRRWPFEFIDDKCLWKIRLNLRTFDACPPPKVLPGVRELDSQSSMLTSEDGSSSIEAY